MKKRLLSIVTAIAIVCSCVALGMVSVSAEGETVSGFLDRFRQDATLVFDDEFDGNAVDYTKWQYSEGWGRNQELYGHVDDGNVKVENGNLVLTAREETRYNTTAKKEGYRYISSGEVTTGGKAAWKYGLIEVRAKLPKGQGVYPAIWTMGYDYDIGSCNWPWSGEIDIMEAVGKGDTDDKNTDTWQTLHYARQNSEDMAHTLAHLAKGVGKYNTAGGKALNDDYHNFWVYFDNKVLIIGVDETMMKIMDLTTDELRAFAEYEQFLILGLQMGGGTATGDIAIELTKNSVWEMLVDYVRVYQFEDDSKYDDYRIFEAESFNTDSNVAGATSLCSRDCVTAAGTQSLNSVITGLEAGTYDIYGAISTSTSESTYEPYIQGEKVEGVTISTYEEKPDGDTPYLGTVKLENNLPFELVLKNTKAASSNTTNLEVDKYFFVKTTREPAVTINESNCYKASDRVEVSTADELAAALSEVDFDGTVVLTDDITLTKNLTITKNLTLDLGGHTINTGTLSKPFSINSQGAAVKIQNGNFIVNGNNGVIVSFVALDQKSTAVEFDSINLEFSAYKYTKTGYVFIGSQFASGGKTITMNNCDVKFTGENTDLGSNQYLLSGVLGATTFNIINSTFSGNSALNLIYTENPNSGYSKGTVLKNCNIENFGIVYNAKADLNSNGNPVKLANTSITNCTSLANSDANALKFLPVTNNTITKADGTVIESADITNDIGTIKYVCTHEYNDATCTSPKICKYCALSEGDPLGHTAGDAEVTDGDCLHDSVSTVKCTTCGDVISSEVVSKAAGHTFTVEKIDDDSCTLLVQNDVTSTSPDNPSFKRDGVHFAKYFRRTCTQCGHVETYSGKNGRAYGSSGHTVDPDSVVEFDNCKLGHGYYYTCAVCGETNIKKTLTLGKHKLAVDSITEPTETEDGVINYKCTECDYTEQSEAIPYGTHYVTVDGVKYPAIDNFFVTPYDTDSSFIGYFDGTKLIDGNIKLDVTEDITLESVKLSLKMLRGASMRYSNPTGIRYYTDIDKDALEKLETLGADVQFGTLICPKDVLGFEDLRLDMQGENINVVYDSEEWYTKGDFSGVVGSITDIKSENINREFVGRGYATVTLGDYTKTIYADYKNEVVRNNTRTIGYIANCIKSSDTYNNLADFKKELIDSFTKE